MSATKTETQLAVIDASDFALMQVDPSEIAEVFAENLGGDALRLSDLTTIHIPSGGAVAWSISDIDGEISTPTLEGVVIAHKTVRRFYEKDFASSGGGSAPDCKSEDGVHGIGVCADKCQGMCDRCPMAQFVKDEKDNWMPTRCKQYTIVFLVRKESALPAVLVIAPTSIRAFSNYKHGLASQKAKRLSAVLTEFSLVKEKSSTGLAYSKIQVRPLQYFEPDVQKKFRDFGLQMQGFLSAYIAPDNLEGSAEYVDPNGETDLEDDMNGFSDMDLSGVNLDDIPSV